MKILIFVNEKNGWFTPWAKKLKNKLEQQNHTVDLLHEAEHITAGDIAFYLSCTVMVRQEILDLHQHNLVCHPSDLPKGRGMSPLTWEILAGNNTITLTLFEATLAMDAVDIYYQSQIFFSGTELNEELKHAQGEETVNLCLKFIEDYPNVTARKQQGEPSFYRRRKPEDSKLDINKSIKEQFNLLRIVDNERYPAYFEHLGVKYVLKIFKESK